MDTTKNKRVLLLAREKIHNCPPEENIYMGKQHIEYPVIGNDYIDIISGLLALLKVYTISNGEKLSALEYVKRVVTMTPEV